MSVLVVGMSHKSAPLEVLEKVALDPTASVKLSQLVLETPFVTESVVVSTCNRVEIYVEAERFHGAVEEVSRLLAEHAQLGREEFVRHVYVHFDEAAVAHLFGVAAGMDSMILGESQILGQVRDSLLTAQNEATVGPALNALFQQALRIGKRGHAETGIDRLAPSIVTAAFAAAGDVVDAPETHFLIAGAGTMAKLAVRTLVERGVAPRQIAVANRTYERAQDLAIESGARAIRWDDMDDELATVDVLISCTGANGVVFDRPRVEAAGTRLQALIDLALPRDIDSTVRDVDGISLIDLVVLSKPPRTPNWRPTSSRLGRSSSKRSVRSSSPRPHRRSPRRWWRFAPWRRTSWMPKLPASRRVCLTSPPTSWPRFGRRCVALQTS